MINPPVAAVLVDLLRNRDQGVQDCHLILLDQTMTIQLVAALPQMGLIAIMDLAVEVELVFPLVVLELLVLLSCE